MNSFVLDMGYTSLVLDIDPTNQEAQDYLSGRKNDCDGMIILGEIGKTKYNTMEAFLNDVKDETPLIGVITI